MTRNRPKPLVTVQHKALIDYTLNNLINQGVTDIGVNLHYHSEQIIEHIKCHYSQHADIQFFYEPSLLDTGGAIANAKAFLTTNNPEGFFILHNADVICDIDLSCLTEHYQKTQPLAVLAVSNRTTSRPLLFDNKLHLLKRGKPEESGAKAFSGIHLVSTRALAYTSHFGPAFSIIDLYLKAINDGEQVVGTDISSNLWFDVGTPDRLQKAERADLSNANFVTPTKA